MFRRILRAIALDKKLYHEVARDGHYNAEALLIAIAASGITAVSPLLSQSSSALSLLFALVMNNIFFAWLFWSVVAYFVARLLGGHGRLDELVRVMAFASAPRLLALLAFVPVVSGFCLLGSGLLTLAATVIAIRETMELSTMKAAATTVLGLAVYVASSASVVALLGGGSAISRLLGGT